MSGCKDPDTKVHFVVEKDVSIFAESRPMTSMKNDTAFNLSHVWNKDDRHSHMWSSGLSTVPFDSFSAVKRFFLPDGNTSVRTKHLKSADVFAMMSMEMIQSFARIGMSTKMTMFKAMGPASPKLHHISEPELRMSEDEVLELSSECFAKMVTEIGKYSEGVYQKFARKKVRPWN